MNDTDLSSKIDHIKSWLGTGSINIFGRQFAGKDTQCARLAQDLDGVVIGGGDILRKSNMSAAVMEQVNAGHLSPTEEYKAVVTPYFAKPEFKNRPLLLSSVGRMKGEEETIIPAAAASGHEIKAVVFLDVDEATTWERFHKREENLREVRTDDDEAAIHRRLSLFNESTLPVLDVYRSLGLVIDIDGSEDPDTVHQAIIDALYQRANS